MKKRIYLFSLLGCLMMLGYLFTACSGSVENTPESVAAFAVKAYQKGNFADLKEYSTEDLRLCGGRFHQNRFFQYAER